MIQDSYVALCQEPWCFTPEQVARLTDWQIVNLYFGPAVERSKQMEAARHGSGAGAAGGDPKPVGPRRERESRPSGSGPDHEPGTPGHRKQVVEMAFMRTMGLKREQAEAMYDRQLAQWHAEQKAEQNKPRT